MKLKKTHFITGFIFAFTFSNCSSNKNMVNSSTLTYSKFKATQKSFLSSDGTLKYIDKGEGKVILLLHGIPTSSWLYRKMIDGLVEEGYRVIAPDMLGFGNSDNPDGYELYNAKQHGKRILLLL
jgi:pimeloyl-ACP methyl ester carboxylesterase